MSGWSKEEGRGGVTGRSSQGPSLKPLTRIARGDPRLIDPQRDVGSVCLVRSPFLHTVHLQEALRANLYTKPLREALLYAYNTHVLLCNVSFCCVETTSIKVNKSLTTERLWTLLPPQFNSLCEFNSPLWIDQARIPPGNLIHFDSLGSEHGQGLPTPALRHRPCSPRG